MNGTSKNRYLIRKVIDVPGSTNMSIGPVEYFNYSTTNTNIQSTSLLFFFIACSSGAI